MTYKNISNKSIVIYKNDVKEVIHPGGLIDGEAFPDVKENRCFIPYDNSAKLKEVEKTKEDTMATHFDMLEVVRKLEIDVVGLQGRIEVLEKQVAVLTATNYNVLDGVDVEEEIEILAGTKRETTKRK